LYLGKGVIYISSIALRIVYICLRKPGDDTPFSFLDMHPEEVARQLTLIEYLKHVCAPLQLAHSIPHFDLLKI
jgi:hypothetical protein